jgi:hypothetical protein
MISIVEYVLTRTHWQRFIQRLAKEMLELCQVDQSKVGMRIVLGMLAVQLFLAVHSVNLYHGGQLRASLGLYGKSVRAR